MSTTTTHPPTVLEIQQAWLDVPFCLHANANFWQSLWVTVAFEGESPTAALILLDPITRQPKYAIAQPWAPPEAEAWVQEWREKHPDESLVKTMQARHDTEEASAHLYKGAMDDCIMRLEHGLFMTPAGQAHFAQSLERVEQSFLRGLAQRELEEEEEAQRRNRQRNSRG